MAHDLPTLGDGNRLSLPQAFLLLSLKEKEGTLLADTIRAQHGLAGAILAELALAEVLTIQTADSADSDVHQQYVHVEKNAQPAFPLTVVCANALSQIRRSKHQQSATDWVSDLAPSGLRHRVAEPLLDAGVLTRKRRWKFGLIPMTSYPEADPTVEIALREFLIDRGHHRNTSTSASVIIGLLQAVGMTRKVLGTFEAAQLNAVVLEANLPHVVQQAVQAAYFATLASVSATGTDLS